MNTALLCPDNTKHTYNVRARCTLVYVGVCASWNNAEGELR